MEKFFKIENNIYCLTKLPYEEDCNTLDLFIENLQETDGLSGSWTASLLKKHLLNSDIYGILKSDKDKLYTDHKPNCDASRKINKADIKNYEICSILIGRKVLDIFEIDFLATKGQFKNKGLMKALLNVLLYDSCCLAGVNEVFLEVSEHNYEARRLYEKSGFKVNGIRSQYYSNGDSALVYSFQKS